MERGSWDGPVCHFVGGDDCMGCGSGTWAWWFACSEGSCEIMHETHKFSVALCIRYV